MAKKKERIDIKAEIREEFGDVIISGRELMDKEREIFSVGPALDIALGGGIPAGCIVMCAAKEKFGKTYTALQAAKNWQERFPQGTVWHIDAEARLRDRNVAGVIGLDMDRFDVIRSQGATKNFGANILYGEKLLNIAKKLLFSEPYAFVIIDSLSAICPESEMIDAPSATIRAAGPKLVANFLRQVKEAIPLNHCILWSIHQMYMNTSGYGKHWLIDGGSKIKYCSDVCLTQRYPDRKLNYYPDEDAPDGQEIEWHVDFSACGPPNRNAISYLKYGHGIDDQREVMELATSVGIIQKNKAWYNYGDQKFHGKDKVYEALNNDHAFYLEVYDKVKEVFGCESQTSKDTDTSGDTKAEAKEKPQKDTK